MSAAHTRADLEQAVRAFTEARAELGPTVDSPG
jgi:hypothetical protein